MPGKHIWNIWEEEVGGEESSWDLPTSTLTVSRLDSPQRHSRVITPSLSHTARPLSLPTLCSVSHSPTHTSQKPASPLGCLPLCHPFIHVLLFELIDISLHFSYYLWSNASAQINPKSSLPMASFTCAVSSWLHFAVRRIEILPVWYTQVLSGPPSSCRLGSWQFLHLHLFVVHTHLLHTCMALF